MAIALFCAVCLVDAFGQQPVWKRFSDKDGLPVNTITSFAQTQGCLMWMGSQEGLIRFDGTTFTLIGNGGLERPYVQDILIDREQNLWLGTRSGLWKYDILTSELVKLKHEGVDIAIRDMTWNRDSTHIIAATEEGLFVYRPDDTWLKQERHLFKGEYVHQVHRFGEHIVATVINRAVVWMNQAYDIVKELPVGRFIHGMAWYEPLRSYLILSDTGLFSVDAASGRVQAIKLPLLFRKLSLSWCMMLDGLDRLWVNIEDTMYCIANLAGNPAISRHYWEKDNPGSFVHNPIGFFEDHLHNIWIGSGGHGLAVLYRSLSPVSYTPRSAFAASHIWSVYDDTLEQVVLYGTDHSIVACGYGSSRAAARIIHKPPGSVRFLVSCFVSFDKDHWLVGTYGSGLWMLHKKKYTLTPFRGIKIPGDYNVFYYLPDGSLLLLGVGFIHRYFRDGKTDYNWGGEAPGNCTAIVPADSSHYWIGTTNGVQLRHKSGRLIRTYLPEEVNPKATSDFPVMALYRDERTRDVFVATMNWGLCKIGRDRSRIVRLPLIQHPSMVYGVVPYGAADLLLSTGSGLVRYNPESGKSSLINTSTGLPFNEFDQLGYHYASGRYTFLGAEGIISFPDTAVQSLFAEQPSFRFLYGNLPVAQLSLPDTVRSLELSITSGTDAIAQTARYRYRILELEQVPHVAYGHDQIRYNYLPAGTYTLSVVADDIHGRFSPAHMTMRIEVQPKWYETGWFRLLAVASGLLVLVLLVRYVSHLRLKWNLRRLEAQQKVAEERLRISRELHDNVGSQLTYLITGLEASGMMLAQQRTDSLSANLEQLQLSAHESMQQLRDAIWALNKEEMTIELLAERFRSWVVKMTENKAMEVKFAFDTGFSVRLDAVATLNVFRLLQEAVHNTIRHSQAGSLTVSITSSPHACVFILADDGVGINDGGQEGSGLRNMKARARQAGAELVIESRVNEGTRIVLTCPVK